ncbi:hypothetical protein CANARDRAFT_28732 [[Candida] arabinofermentans NRRL YB-2248]|uniref:Uncharacterized protein n=1 Tax=[Candida] arabinofermentans NRRL YB-2248 TaxID=983967 RepID=A0A1E4SZT5_9ASCO|nr:hypothetical protein CANARDRAFT_28732 [[Candida] arabinofermentans NRRL YB-2248]
MNDVSNYSLKNLHNLKYLRLRNCGVSDSFMFNLTPNIEILELMRCNILKSDYSVLEGMNDNGFFKLPLNLKILKYSTRTIPIELPDFINLRNLQFLKIVEIRLGTMISQKFIDDLSNITKLHGVDELLIECKRPGVELDWIGQVDLNKLSLGYGLRNLEIYGYSELFDLNILPKHLNYLKLDVSAFNYRSNLNEYFMNLQYLELNLSRCRMGKFSEIFQILISRNENLKSLIIYQDDDFVDLTGVLFGMPLNIQCFKVIIIPNMTNMKNVTVKVDGVSDTLRTFGLEYPKSSDLKIHLLHDFRSNVDYLRKFKFFDENFDKISYY